MTISRNRLGDVLRAGGVRVGPASDGGVASVVAYADGWGVMPGVGPCCGEMEIKAALLSSGVGWSMHGRMIIVAG